MNNRIIFGSYYKMVAEVREYL